MKKLSLVSLYKAEIKKNMMAHIKGGTEVKCTCAVNHPMVSTRESGGPVGNYCICDTTTSNSVGVQNKAINL